MANTPTHGYLGSAAWASPACVARSDELARPGYISEDASEYLDQPDVLAAKVRLLAELVRASKSTVAYTGAGLSTASGIGDYASRAKHTLAVHWDAQKATAATSLRARPPTRAHRALAALERAGMLHGWVNQNHDGLAQKATYPQAKLIEIHGSWYDPRNPVVKMNGSLRADLYARMRACADGAHLVLALGTSLSGLAADCVAEECAARALTAREGTSATASSPPGGLVIVALQRTRLDGSAALRIHARLDDTLEMLARELEIKDMPTDEEVRDASRDPTRWYASVYDPSDGAWERETRAECLERAQPGRSKK